MDKRINIDDLTGLEVKRNFDRSFEKVLQNARVAGSHLSILMMDMGGLKGINDSHGHLMGAHCISSVGKLVKEVTSDQGLATRFGGDEFTAYLVDMDKEAATQWAENLRLRIEDFPFEKDGVRVYPTISIGIATFPAATATGSSMSTPTA